MYLRPHPRNVHERGRIEEERGRERERESVRWRDVRERQSRPLIERGRAELKKDREGGGRERERQTERERDGEGGERERQGWE